MAVGITIQKNDIDMLAGQVCRDVQVVFDRVGKLQAWLAAKPDADLQAPPFGYTAAEVACLKSAIADLDKLRKVAVGLGVVAADGTFTPGPGCDLFQFVRHLSGIAL